MTLATASDRLCAIVVDNATWTYQGAEIYATVNDQGTIYPDKPYLCTAHVRFTLDHDPQAARKARSSTGRS
jgi:hypothetical protein